MTLHLDDLPPDVRRAILARSREVETGVAGDEAQPVLSARLSRPPRSRGDRWRCHRCGVESTTLAATERHADRYSHPRYELVI